MQTEPDGRHASTEARATVAIVGAGPSGTATALRLARLGFSDVLLLDAFDFPRDKTCGSGLSHRSVEVLRELGLYERIRPMSYPIHGMRLVTPGRRELVLSSGDHEQALICRRRDLDEVMLTAAIGRGVKFVPHFHAVEPLLEGDRWIGVRGRDGRVVRAETVVIANGAHSRLVIDQSPRRTIHTLMGWWSHVPYAAHTAEMVFDPMLSPYYGWLFPETEDRVNIGITYEDDALRLNPRDLFMRFLDANYADRLRGARPVRDWRGHPIVYTYAIRDLTSPGRIVVGEAGRMTHPATGEGIYHAMRSGVFAAEAIYDIAVRGHAEAAAYRRYIERCRGTFLPGFWLGRFFRGLVRTPLLDWIADFGSLPAVSRATGTLLSSL